MSRWLARYEKGRSHSVVATSIPTRKKLTSATANGVA
jgi:hypothetical protein